MTSPRPAQVIHRSDAPHITKSGVDMVLYGGDGERAAIVHQRTRTGHGEEIVHHRSTFLYYVIAGSGTWVIEDTEHPAEAGDLVIVPPGSRFHFFGDLEQLCITAPAWTAEHEESIRTVGRP